MNWQQRSLENSLGKRQQQAAERGRQILASAQTLLLERGDFEFTVQDVVRHCGLSLRAFYQLFAGKEELLLAIFEEAIAGLAHSAGENLAGMNKPKKKLKYLTRCLYGERGLLRAPIRPQITAFTVARPDALQTALEPLLQLFEAAIVEGQQAGIVKAGDARQFALSFLLTVMMHTEASGLGLLEDQWPAIDRDALFEFCFSAIKS